MDFELTKEMKEAFEAIEAKDRQNYVSQIKIKLNDFLVKRSEEKYGWLKYYFDSGKNYEDIYHHAVLMINTIAVCDDQIDEDAIREMEELTDEAELIVIRKVTKYMRDHSDEWTLQRDVDFMNRMIFNRVYLLERQRLLEEDAVRFRMRIIVSQN